MSSIQRNDPGTQVQAGGESRAQGSPDRGPNRGAERHSSWTPIAQGPEAGGAAAMKEAVHQPGPAILTEDAVYHRGERLPAIPATPNGAISAPLEVRSATRNPAEPRLLADAGRGSSQSDDASEATQETQLNQAAHNQLSPTDQSAAQSPGGRGTGRETQTNPARVPQPARTGAPVHAAERRAAAVSVTADPAGGHGRQPGSESARALGITGTPGEPAVASRMAKAASMPAEMVQSRTPPSDASAGPEKTVAAGHGSALQSDAGGKGPQVQLYDKPNPVGASSEVYAKPGTAAARAETAKHTPIKASAGSAGAQAWPGSTPNPARRAKPSRR